MTFNDITPLNKFNNGSGTTLCRSCRTMLTNTGFTNKLLCDDCLNSHMEMRKLDKWGVCFNRYGVCKNKKTEVYIYTLTDSHLFNIVEFLDKQDRLVPSIILNEIYFRTLYPKYRIKSNIKWYHKLLGPLFRSFAKHIMKRKTTNMI